MSISGSKVNQRSCPGLASPAHRRHALAAIGVAVLFLSACGVTQSTRSPQILTTQDSIALLPIVNHTDVPQAGLRSEALVEATLRTKGLRNLQLYPPQLNPESLFEPSERKAQLEAEKWAKSQNIRFVVYGSVEEWRYKIGVDGEPAVGMTLHIKDLRASEVVFSASGGRTGYSREALSAIAQKLVVQLLAGVQVVGVTSAGAAPPAPPTSPSAPASSAVGTTSVAPRTR